MDEGGAAESTPHHGAFVVLAYEHPFRIGQLDVDPATLTVWADNWSKRLEPRVMQVLVVLAGARHRVVGRGELNARVWGGRIIGEDAINRAIQALRRLAAEAPPPAPFIIETIPRIGYRLAATTDTQKFAPRDATVKAPDKFNSVPRRTLRPPLWFASALIVVIASAILWSWLSRGNSQGDWIVVRAQLLDDLPPDSRDAVLSPDGMRLAYRAPDAAGRDRIYIRKIDSGAPGTPESPPDVDARRPAWSPDGSQLAFASYDSGRPCTLYVAPSNGTPTSVGNCETVREPRLAWSTDGRSLLFGDAPGENAVQRIGALRLGDKVRTVLSSPPGDSMGDALPISEGQALIFQRQFRWADEGWMRRDSTQEVERLLWRRAGVAGSIAAPIAAGNLAIAWTASRTSGIDVVDTRGRITVLPVALGPVTGLSSAKDHLLVEIDRSESALIRVGSAGSAASAINVRGRIAGPIVMPDGSLRFPASSAGVARIWQSDGTGRARPWGDLSVARVSGLALSPDTRWTAALITSTAGREIVVLDQKGRISYRWNPRARSVNPAAWSADGRHLIAPVLDGAGWRLLRLDPFGGASPNEIGMPGFAVLRGQGAALYAVRAGETTGVRELWRLDGGARRLPIDLTLFDIVNWCATAEGLWVPDRSIRNRPKLLLRDPGSGRILRTLDAPGLAGAGTGLAADRAGPVYVRLSRDAPEYSLLTLARRPSSIKGRD